MYKLLGFISLQNISHQGTLKCVFVSKGIEIIQYNEVHSVVSVYFLKMCFAILHHSSDVCLQRKISWEESLILAKSKASHCIRA